MDPTREQLEAFAEKANERFPDHQITLFEFESDGLFAKTLKRGLSVPRYGGCDFFVEGLTSETNGDMRNAAFLIWCLDRLEELHAPTGLTSLEFGVDLLGKTKGHPEYQVQIIAYPDSDAWVVDTFCQTAETRALAVFWALFHALGCTEPQVEHPTPTNQKQVS